MPIIDPLSIESQAPHEAHCGQTGDANREAAYEFGDPP